MGGALLFGLGEGSVLVGCLTLRAESTPNVLMGRISGISGLLSRVAGGVGVAWMGLSLQWLRGPGTFGLLAALSLLLGGWTAINRPRAVVDA